MEQDMSTPLTKKPTRKAFHFPKSADSEAPRVDAQTPTTEPATRKKVTTAKRASTSELEQVIAREDRKLKSVKKAKVVRDSFTMPASDYEKIAALKRKCRDAGVSVKKSELLRAGLHLLEVASAKRFLAAVTALDAVKTGRPAKN
jgi:hypothetical protein